MVTILYSDDMVTMFYRFDVVTMFYSVDVVTMFYSVDVVTTESSRGLCTPRKLFIDDDSDDEVITLRDGTIISLDYILYI